MSGAGAGGLPWESLSTALPMSIAMPISSPMMKAMIALRLVLDGSDTAAYSLLLTHRSNAMSATRIPVMTAMTAMSVPAMEMPYQLLAYVLSVCSRDCLA